MDIPSILSIYKSLEITCANAEGHNMISSSAKAVLCDPGNAAGAGAQQAVVLLEQVVHAALQTLHLLLVLAALPREQRRPREACVHSPIRDTDNR